MSAAPRDRTAAGPAVGVVGLGLLGGAIAERLLAHGFTLLGCDLDPARVERLGIVRAATPEAVARECETVVLSLPDSRAVEEVVSGPAGLLAAGRGSLLVIDTTTGDPEVSRRVAARWREAGGLWVEAAVGGSSELVREGEGVLYVGGRPEEVARAGPVLDAIAPVAFHLGDVGTGGEAKLVTNLVLGLNRLALAEGLALGEALGIPALPLLEVLRAGPARSAALEAKGARMARREYGPPQARLRQHLKDVGLILELGARAGVSLPVSELHQRLLERAVELGWGESDNAAIREVFGPPP